MNMVKSEIRYEVVETYNVEKGKELAPHIKQEFESIKKVDIAAWGGGVWYHTIIRLHMVY